MSTYIVWKTTGMDDSIILSGIPFTTAYRLVQNLADEYPRDTFWMVEE